MLLDFVCKFSVFSTISNKLVSKYILLKFYEVRFFVTMLTKLVSKQQVVQIEYFQTFVIMLNKLVLKPQFNMILRK